MKNSTKIIQKLKPYLVDSEAIVFNNDEMLNISFFICDNKPQIEISTIYEREYYYPLKSFFTFERMKNFALKNNMGIKFFAIWNNGRIKKFNFEKNIFEF